MTIVACPKCADSVVLPSRAGQRARVRCPLCQEEFPLAEVLNKMPPALVVVDDPDAATATVAAAGRGASPAPVVLRERDGLRTNHLAAGEEAPPPFIESESDGGGFGPLSFETAAGAPAASARRRRRPAAPARRKPKSPLAEGAKIVLGGVAGLLIAQVILWWVGSAKEWPSKRADISGMAPQVARYVPWIVPERYRLEKPSGAAGPTETGGSATALGSGAVPPRELPTRTFTNPTEDAGAGGEARTSSAKTRKPAKSQVPGGPDALGADVRAPDPFDIAASPTKPETDLTTVPEPDIDPLADLKLDSDMSPDDQAVADPALKPVEPAKEESAGEPKQAAVPALNLPQTTAAELRSAVDEARRVVEALKAAPASDSRSLLGQTYSALAKLGHTAACCSPSGGAELQTAAEWLESATAEVPQFTILGTAAGRWLTKADRDNDGVLLVGTVKQVRQQGGYRVTELVIPGRDGTLAVYRDAASGDSYPPDTQLVVLGAIIADPAKILAGYEGDGDVVVWEGLAKHSPHHETFGRY